MGLDFLLVLGADLFALQRERRASTNPSRETSAGLLFWFGLIPRIGQVLIRFTNDGAWWTGRLRNAFP